MGQYQKHTYSERDSTRKIENLDISIPALRELGAGYLLSSVEVGNHEPLGLTFEKAFEREDSPWQIFLYSLAP